MHPVFFGSAITGAGVDALMAGIADLLPAASGRRRRSRLGQRLQDRARPGRREDRLRRGCSPARCGRATGCASVARHERKVTAISVFDAAGRAARVRRPRARSAKLWGLAEIRIGDAIGDAAARQSRAPVRPADAGDGRRPARPDDSGRAPRRARAARRAGPADQRPPGRRGREISVSLYGEVQKEVIEATLATDFGIEVSFRETTTICIERPDRHGRGRRGPARRRQSVPRHARLARRAGAAGSGVEFRLDVDARSVPIYIYKTARQLRRAHAASTSRGAREGLFGWQVTDCTVTMTECGYSVPDGPLGTGTAEHGSRLPQAHAPRSDAGARAGEDGRVRADGPRQPRDPDGARSAR